MNFLIVHNTYSACGGEETVVAFQKSLLEKHGHKVRLYVRAYSDMDKWLLGKAGGTFTSIFNYRSVRDLKRLLKKERFDVVLLHNLFPVISPAIIPFLKRKGVRVLQVVHNYRLFCPVGTFFTNNSICNDCLKRGREWHCMRKRCTGGVFSAASFAFKFSTIRLLNYYGGIDRFLVLNEVQADLISRYMKAGNKVSLLPNCVEVSADCNSNLPEKKLVSFVGRLTPEKGFFDFLETAAKMPDYEFAVAGEKDGLPSVYIPSNVKFYGFLRGDALEEFYARSRVVLFLSKCYEGFGLVVIEAMKHSTPVIAYDTWAAKSVVADGKSGFIVPNGDTDLVASCVRRLFEDSSLFETLAKNAQRRVAENYSNDKYYERLIEIVKKVRLTKF